MENNIIGIDWRERRLLFVKEFTFHICYVRIFELIKFFFRSTLIEFCGTGVVKASHIYSNERKVHKSRIITLVAPMNFAWVDNILKVIYSNVQYFIRRSARRRRHTFNIINTK